MKEILFSNLVGGAIGLLVTSAVGWALYRKAAKDAEQSLTILARFLEQYARVTIPEDRGIEIGFTRDETGHITNANVTVTLEPVVGRARVQPLEPRLGSASAGDTEGPDGGA